MAHPGNDVKHPGSKPIIDNFAEDQTKSTLLEQVSLLYPASHSMSSRWDAMRSKEMFALLGRFGDTVDFKDLSPTVQSATMATELGAVAVGGGVTETYEACGSPGEVASDPSKGHRYQMFLTDKLHGDETDVAINNNDGKKMIWANLALFADDQLRQRMAWALAQVFVICEAGLQNPAQPEHWVVFYDILVRNAFGDFRQLIREVSYSPAMGKFLTYAGNKAWAAANTLPDENYARELMQIFTIGLNHLRLDGTVETDADGAPLPTYTNVNIETFARVWTGFNLQAFRGNIEAKSGAKR